MTGNKINEMDPEMQKIAMASIENTGGSIQSGFFERQRDLKNTLFVLSTGGVITMLTYMHDASDNSLWLIGALLVFLLAIIFTLAWYVFDYYYWRNQLTHYAEDIDKFEHNLITWQTVRYHSGNKGKYTFASLCMGTAIGFFALALLLGLIGYLPINHFNIFCLITHALSHVGDL